MKVFRLLHNILDKIEKAISGLVKISNTIKNKILPRRSEIFTPHNKVTLNTNQNIASPYKKIAKWCFIIFDIILTISVFAILNYYIAVNTLQKKTIYLADVVPDYYSGNSLFVIGKDVPAFVQKKYSKVIWTAPSDDNKLCILKYNIKSAFSNNYNPFGFLLKYDKFVTEFGLLYPSKISKYDLSGAEVKIFVRINGETIKDTIKTLNGKTKPQKLIVPINNNAKTIELCIDPLGSKWSDDAAWINPCLIKESTPWKFIILQICLCVLWLIVVIARIPLFIFK